MFSKFIREDFNHSKGEQYENLLDVVKHAGYQVHWRDNNTGCQGTCDRITYEDLAYEKLSTFCKDDNCTDEILLHNLQTVVNEKSGDKLVILHQKGNHGPTYHLRYPKEFEVFKPACKTNQLRSCSREEIVNAYDNAILYSDHFISSSIDFLKKNEDKYDTAMVYISDHGESLGENNLYLHGLPYMIAPEQQKKVPFILWLSNSYQQTYGIDKSCVNQKSATKLSHDNLFSSMLGLLAIQTKVHDASLDIFSSCSKTQLAKKQ
jgi:lipid A ethanolaminephosphotransferase